MAFNVGDKVKIKYDNRTGFIFQVPTAEEQRYLVRYVDRNGAYPKDFFYEFELSAPGVFGTKEIED
jgi:hypothetical protein